MPEAEVAITLVGELNEPRALMYLRWCVRDTVRLSGGWRGVLHSSAAEGGAVGEVEALDVLLYRCNLNKNETKTVMR